MIANCGNILFPCICDNYMLSLYTQHVILQENYIIYGYSGKTTARALKSNNIFKRHIMEKFKKSKAERAKKDV